MDPATGAKGRTRRYQRETGTQEGHGLPVIDGRLAPEAPRRPGVGSPAISGMGPAGVNATRSFAAPLTPEQLDQLGVGPRPRGDVIARIKSNTKTHRGTPRPLEHEQRITGDYEKPIETAASEQRPLDRDTLQELAEADGGAWHAEAHHRPRPEAPQIRPSAPGSRPTIPTAEPAAPQIRPHSAPRARTTAPSTEPAAPQIRPSSAPRARPAAPTTEPDAPQLRPPSAPSSRPTAPRVQPVAEVTPVRRAPDALLRPASEPPAFDLSRSELPRTRRYDDPGRWPVTAIVVSTLLAALLGGLIAMAATGG